MFGCQIYLHVPDSLRKKLDRKSQRLIFVGYDNNSTNYRLYNPETKVIKTSRHVTFNADNVRSTPRANAVISLEAADEEFQPQQSEQNEQEDEQEQKMENVENEKGYGLRSRDEIKRPQHLEDFDVDFEANGS